MLFRSQKSFMIKGVVACVWLLVVYGSWRFSDNPSAPYSVELSSSYARYFLPFYVFGLWLGGLALAKLWNLKYGKILVGFLLIIYISLSGNLVIFNKESGLLAVRQSVQRFEATRLAVEQFLSPRRALVTGITDKFFWPEHPVIINPTTNSDYEGLRRLIRAQVAVYNFHGTWTDQGLQDYVGKVLKPQGLTLELVAKDFFAQSLYQYKLQP